MSDAIIEAAAEALHKTNHYAGPRTLEVIVAAVTPLIRAAALEDVVQVIVHSQHIGINATVELVRSVRALKEKP